MKILKIIIAVFVAIALIMIGYLSIGHYQSTVEVPKNVIEHANYLEFDNQSDTGFIFYPGAKVEPAAYSYLADVNANVYIAEFPFDFAILNTDVAQDIIDDNSQVETWYIGGHSLGGVAASMYLEENPSTFKGIVYLASYPASMLEASVKQLAIFGAEDEVVGDYHEKLELFDDSAQIEILENANHSGFGTYGQQKGDSELSDDKLNVQREQIIELINKFIK